MLSEFTLSPDWLTLGGLDQELTEYRLKAFIQRVRQAYRKTFLHPGWEEARYHQARLQAFRTSWNAARNRFPARLKGLDAEKGRLIYASDRAIPDWENWIEEMAAFAAEEFGALTLEGQEIFLQILEDVHLEPVGIEPLYRQEGYLIFTEEEANTRYVYRYQLGPVVGEAYQNEGYKTTLLYSVHPAVSHSHLSIKQELIRRYPELPNPATWQVGSQLTWPLGPTLVPVSLHLLRKRIALS